MRIPDFKSFFNKKEELKAKPKSVLSDEEKFNVDNYNEWFKTIYSGYSDSLGAPGIFLRLDKLDHSMITDWFEYINVDYDDSDAWKMYELVRLNWRKLDI